ncbi:MAG: hypothetical protein E6K36_05120 [Gammaproteobacteria bacterium]|nr:MAG: hypothetical protein E6K40_11425 [Gammaproteobacteria bacterium]TLZ04448.1 MAG: hypothetical protein E6K36_05120 [Gammaproteobacteria bacterium]
MGRSFAGVLRVKGLGRVFGAKAAAAGEEKGDERGGEAGFHGIPSQPCGDTVADAESLDFTLRAYHHRQYLAKNPDGYCGIGGCGVPFSPRSYKVGEKT